MTHGGQGYRLRHEAPRGGIQNGTPKKRRTIAGQLTLSSLRLFLLEESYHGVMDPDTLMRDSDADATPNTRHFVVAVDFGTTFSSVAYVGYTHPSQRCRIGFQQVEFVDRYPDHPYGNFTCHDVPTEIWYTAKPIHHDRDDFEHQTLVDDISSGDNDDDASDTDTSSEGTSEPDQLFSAPLNGDSKPASLFWGYGVQDQLKEADYDADHSRRLSRFKLMLDESPHTANVRNTLSETCKSLKKMRLIEDDTDVIADYLEQLFQHTKKRLIESEGYTDASTVEFVLCVPAIWEAKASRKMQVAMGRAIKNSRLGRLQNGSINNLFLVSEPEAAAVCVLASEKTRLKIGDTFILLDAGGGTVDAITYTVDKDIPLRLKTEEVVPGGALCGSSFINERFEDLLIKRLKHEDYLGQSGETLSKIINGVVIDFERRDKKKIDSMFPDQVVDCTVKVPGLRENKKRRFMKGRMCLSRKEIKKLFQPSLDGVAQVMKDQLRMAQQKGCEVKKVILMGGFGQSESLSAHLRDTLANECELGGQNIVLDSSKLQSTAVACGAVIRALRKEDGPARILQSSYGFLRTEPFGTQAAHASQKPKPDKIDGLDYIDNTIEWVINKGDTLVSEQVIEKKVEYTFALRKKRLLCTEALYVSDHRHESHYRLGHPRNDGAERAGSVEVDMTFLRTTGQITPQPPPKPGMFPFWKVSVELLIFVSGRNLRFEIHLPDGNGEVHGVGQTPLAAAFRPGTE